MSSKKGSGGKISERELYEVRLDVEDNELEAALARSRRLVNDFVNTDLFVIDEVSSRCWFVILQFLINPLV